MGVSIKCIAVLKDKLDENWTIKNQYVCEDIGEEYIIYDNHGGSHHFHKNGVLIKHFIISEV